MLVNPVQLVCTRVHDRLHDTLFIKLHPVSCHPSLAFTGAEQRFSSGHTLKRICEMRCLKQPTYLTVLNTIFIMLFFLRSVASGTFQIGIADQQYSFTKKSRLDLSGCIVFAHLKHNLAHHQASLKNTPTASWSSAEQKTVLHNMSFNQEKLTC